MSLKPSNMIDSIISSINWEERNLSAGAIQLTFGASGVFIQKVGEIPNLGMYSYPAISSRAVFLQFRAGYLQVICGVHFVVWWISACLSHSGWKNVCEKLGKLRLRRYCNQSRVKSTAVDSANGACSQLTRTDRVRADRVTGLTCSRLSARSHRPSTPPGLYRLRSRPAMGRNAPTSSRSRAAGS